MLYITQTTMKNILPIAIILTALFFGCKKESTTPNTNNYVTNTTVVNVKWSKVKAHITYAPDGVTEGSSR